MAVASDLRSGKSHKDENFPVASRIIHPRHRALILAFYDFVRTGDDISDHATLPPAEKLALLDRLEADLLGDSDSQPEAVRLRALLAERGLSPRHPIDVLKAFRLDVTKDRYENWDELIDYCRYSAMPVGRFVLDVHGESHATWAASDALCAALQVINHVQDCGKDYRSLRRVYLPRDAMAVAGVGVEALGAERASAALLACLHGLAARTEGLLRDSQVLAVDVVDTRLGFEISVIQSYAARITSLLKVRDPLNERVHLSKWELMACGVGALAGGFVRRSFGRRPVSRTEPGARQGR